MNRRYEQAIEVLKSIQETARVSFVTRLGDSPGKMLAMAYALAGHHEEARMAVEDFRRMLPFASIAHFRSLYDHHKRPEDLEFRLDALRRAGFPRWPFGYQGSTKHRANESELKALTMGRTWTGWDVSANAAFVKEFATDGSVMYASKTTLMSGTAELQGDVLCEQFTLSMLGRPRCGYVYRTQDGTATDGNEFTYVNSYTIFKFSIKK